MFRQKKTRALTPFLSERDHAPAALLLLLLLSWIIFARCFYVFRKQLASSPPDRFAILQVKAIYN